MSICVLDIAIMDKTSYETYEYLSGAENEANQFFVVQSDGTFLNVNRQLQYITEMQDVKEDLESVEPSTVYDVASQQFLIDVDNSSQLISVPDQFILPEGENNIFANNYLLPGPNTTEQEAEQQDGIDQCQRSEMQVDAEVEAQSHKEADCCTEITLSDEQYNTLEQKGWILLETNEKVFVLDTLGLHDITSNERLIQKLKLEDQTDHVSDEKIEVENNMSFSNQQDTIQFLIGEDDKKLTEEIIEDHDSLLNSIECAESAEKPSPDTRQNVIDTTNTETVVLNSTNNDSLETETSKNIFKVKTDICFKDIPDKIILGENENGKMLFAKITKANKMNTMRKAMEIPPRSKSKQTQRKQKSVTNHKIDQKDQLKTSSPDEKQFENLIRLAMQNGGEVKCSAEDVTSANSIVTQLLKIPAFQPSVVDQNLIITKDVSVQDETGALHSRGGPTLVTGRVRSLNEDRYYFDHQPNMLERLMNTSDDYLPPHKKEASQCKVTLEDNNVLHVHVTEIKRADNVLRISITLNKRQLPKIPKNVTMDDKKLPRMIFGCSVCASVFYTETELDEHREIQCMDVKDVLTIDIDKNVKGYTIEGKGKDKSYSCNQCQQKFTRLYNCVKHLKTHFNGKGEMKDGKKLFKSINNEQKKEGIYKCKMCSSTYLHQSTLTKHIVSKHIKVKHN